MEDSAIVELYWQRSDRAIARGLEIRQLDTVVRQEDFVRNAEFGDIYIG